MSYLELDKATGATVLVPGCKPKRKKRVSSFVAWQGASMLDGKPIALLVIRAKGKANEKTGAMVQTYILRSDVSPLDALKTGKDFSICGNCKHRPIRTSSKKKRVKILPVNEANPEGNGTCYVQVQNAPTGIFKAFKRGSYPILSLEEGRENLTGAIVRMGSYGDPAAIPVPVWKELLTGTIGRTGYTHQWESFPDFKAYCMASVDNPSEYALALSHGWRCFYVVPKNANVDTGKAFLCPASEEAGRKLNCIDCLACDGTESKRKASVYIPVHGVQFKQTRFNNLIQISKA
jgi:hypothetical protein